MTQSIHDVAIIPGPTASNVVLRAATGTSSRTTTIIPATQEHGSHYRFSAETSDVWILFAAATDSSPTVDQTAVAGATRPAVHIPAGQSRDFTIDQRNAQVADISDDTNGFFSIVKVS